MSKEINIRIVVEVTKNDHRELDLHQDRITAAKVKEAAGLPLDTELAVRREGELEHIDNQETIDIKNGERFVVIHKEPNVHIVVEITETDHRKVDFHEHRVTGRQIKEAAGVPLDDDLETKEDKKQVNNDETITITDGEHFVVSPHVRTIHYTVNDEPQTTTEKELTPVQIMQNAGIDPAQNYLVEIIDHKKEPFKDNPNISIHMHNGMKFITIFMGPQPVSNRGFRYGQG
jgi:uncharacterized protein YlzI (FlbEa/FlbD family)